MRTPMTKVAAAAEWRLRLLRHEARVLPSRLSAWQAFRRRYRQYQLLDEATLRGTPRSDTVFIFGSGSSLNSITPAEWGAIERHDTIGFNWFVRQTFVRCDYQFVREITGHDADPERWRRDLHEYFDLVRRNSRFSATIFMVQTGFRAINGNRAIGFEYLPKSNRVFLWRSRDDKATPGTSFRDGLMHRHGTLNECINFAALLGWRRIVLAGVDLYDRRYFWLPRDQPREGDDCVEGLHNTARAGLINDMKAWQGFAASRGLELYAYNPRSLLVPTLPVWTWNERATEPA